MDYWDNIWQHFISNPTIKEEYRKAYLLNMFQKICSKMNHDNSFKKYIFTLFRQSFDRIHTVKMIVKREFDILVNEEDANTMLIWFEAYRKKLDVRKPISMDKKLSLYNKQNGVCAVCHESLGHNWKKIHVDHIIPWVLVGDELNDNYQLLCETCNLCKSSRTDFVFRSLIKIV